MAFDTAGPLTRLKAILDDIADVGETYKGIPESVGKKVTASVSVAGQRLEFDAFAIVQRQAGYFVEFAYRVQGNEGAAEDTLAGFVDAFLAAFYADTTLGGTCDDAELDFSLQDDPTYRPTAGQEFRTFPFLVWAQQRAPVG